MKEKSIHYDAIIKNKHIEVNELNKKDEEIKISGEFYGNLYCDGKVLIEKTAKVFGNIKGMDLVSYGKIFGNLYIQNDVYLKGDATLVGEIQCRSIIMSPSVKFTGKCNINGESIASVA